MFTPLVSFVSFFSIWLLPFTPLYSGVDPTMKCDVQRPTVCLDISMAAMGGRKKLEAIEALHLDVIGHTALMEQSYRQAPYITSYERDQVTIDFLHGRILTVQHSVWPESDPKAAESDATLIVTAQGGAYILPTGSSPSSASDIDSAKATLALGPERLLLTAAAATDLHYEPDEVVRSTPHTVLAFRWNGILTRILINQYTHLPDAVDTTREFRDFWYFWGDVHQRIYWDNWKFLHGIVYPTNQITERNGALVASTQVLDLDLNQPLDDKAFATDSTIAARSLAVDGWKGSFKGDNSTELASGITLFNGSWNVTVVKQDDGIVILETPISETFTDGLFARVKKMYPHEQIKAVLSTSDSWPHIGGIRYDVVKGVPVYVLDLNQPLLDRMVSAQHTLDPDELQRSPRRPVWKIVSEKTEVGSGDNRFVIYPLRGSSTERQYMVYFPKHRLLYASDTLVLNPDGSLYDPELVIEVKEAVDRNHLDIATVFAMHQAPVPWGKITHLLQTLPG